MTDNDKTYYMVERTDLRKARRGLETLGIQYDEEFWQAGRPPIYRITIATADVEKARKVFA